MLAAGGFLCPARSSAGAGMYGQFVASRLPHDPAKEGKKYSLKVVSLFCERNIDAVIAHQHS